MGPFHSSMNYQTLAGGIPPDNWTPYGSMPGGPATQLVAGMLGDTWAQKAGMANFGFQTHQNTYDMMRQKAMYQRNREVLQSAAESDRASFEQTMTGAFTAAGVDMNDPVRQAEIKKLSASAASMSGMFATAAPELFDAMHGQRGSSAVMAHYMMQAGRYQIDPITGQVGMSGASLAMQSNQVHQMLYSGDNYMQMKGVRAGEAGRMYDEMVRRGMMGQPLTGQALTRGALATMSAAGDGSLDAAYAKVGIASGTDIRSLTPSQINQLESVQGVRDARSDPATIAKANSSQIAAKLKDMSGAVSAMKEIFGDAGHPNAPMPEIMNALEQMTSGTMSQMSPQRVEGLVRKMHNLSKTSGMSMEATMQLLGTVQSMQSSVGFGNNAAAFSSDIAMSSMAFRGGLDLSSPMWGRSSADQLTLADAQLREQARGSVYTNHMAVLARIGNETGAFGGAQGADARELLAAMSGPNRNDAKVRELMKKHGLSNEGQLTEFISAQSGGRIDASQVATMLSDDHGNQEYAQRYRLQDITRSEQFDSEVRPLLEDTFAGGFTGKLDDAGAAEAGRIMMDSLKGMKEQGYDLGSPRQRAAHVAQALMKQAQTNPALAGLKGKSQAEIEAMVSTSWAAGSRMSQDELHMSLADTFALTDETALERGENRQMSAEREAIIQSSVAHLGKGTMLEKVITAFQSIEGKSDDEIKKGIGTVLGQVDPAKLGPMVDALRSFQKQAVDIENSPEFKADQARLAEIDAKLGSGTLSADEVKKLEAERTELAAGSHGRAMRISKQIEGQVKAITDMGRAAGVDLTKAVEDGSAPKLVDDKVAKVEFPKDGVAITGKIVIEDNRQPMLAGTMNNAGTAPNAAQGGVATT